MRELQFIRSGRLEWWDKRAPTVRGPGDAIVRPFVAGRCDGGGRAASQDDDHRKPDENQVGSAHAHRPTTDGNQCSPGLPSAFGARRRASEHVAQRIAR